MTEQPEGFYDELFQSLTPSALPEGFDDGAFLDGVYERAAEAGQSALAPVLDQGLPPVSVPDQAWNRVAWQEDAAVSAETVAAALPDDPGPAPGVLWTRIRGEVQAERSRRRRSRSFDRFRLAAAAVLLTAGTAGLLRFWPDFSQSGGTPDDAHFVFHEVAPGTDSGLDTLLGK